MFDFSNDCSNIVYDLRLDALLSSLNGCYAFEQHIIFYKPLIENKIHKNNT